MATIKGSSHEKIFKLEDGSRVKIIVRVTMDINRKPEYRFEVYTAEKGKRSWKNVVNRDDYSWRGLSLEEREVKNLEKYIEVATKERLNETALELWNGLKPDSL